MPVSFPSYDITSSSVSLVNINDVFSSNHQRLEQKTAFAQWRGRWEINLPDPADMAGLSAWLLSLNGMIGEFYTYDPDYRLARGSVSGTIRVKGAGQSGDAIILDGFTVSTSDLLLAGDYIQIEDDFYQVTEDADSNTAGECLVKVAPDLQSSHADNVVVTYDNPVMIARLSSNMQSWETGSNKEGKIVIDWEQVK